MEAGKTYCHSHWKDALGYFLSRENGNSTPPKPSSMACSWAIRTLSRCRLGLGITALGNSVTPSSETEVQLVPKKTAKRTRSAPLGKRTEDLTKGVMPAAILILHRMQLKTSTPRFTSPLVSKVPFGSYRKRRLSWIAATLVTDKKGCKENDKSKFEDRICVHVRPGSHKLKCPIPN